MNVGSAVRATKEAAYVKRRIRLIPDLEKNQRLVEAVASPLGRAALLAVFALSLAVHLRGQLLVDTALVLVLISGFPSHRRTILVFAALYWSAVHVPLRWDLVAALLQRIESGAHRQDFAALRLEVIAAVLVFGALVHRFLRARPRNLAARYPAGALVGFYALLLVALTLWPRRDLVWVLAWAFVLVLGQYQWFFALSLIDLRKTPGRAFVPQLGLFHPFWGSTNTPFPKGAAYVEQIEAKDNRAFAVSQLKGLKLLWWSIVLLSVQALLAAVFYGSGNLLTALIPLELPIPPLALAFRASVAGQSFPWSLNAAAMLLDLTMDGLKLSIWGHQIIAVVRVAGFDARRNTYKPFLATSVSEFFNRYYYYFKELLVECFFYPVIYSVPRRRIKLALFAATVSAAGLGNYAYHFFRDVRYTVERGFGRAILDSHVLLVYCLLLSLGIFASQVRRVGKPRQAAGTAARLRGMILVWLIFAVLNSLIVDLWHSDLAQHARFLADALPLPRGE